MHYPYLQFTKKMFAVLSFGNQTLCKASILANIISMSKLSMDIRIIVKDTHDTIKSSTDSLGITVVYKLITHREPI